MAADMETSVLPLYAELGQAGFQPYVLDLDILGLGGSIQRVMTFVVLMRQDGILLALPDGALEAQTIYAYAGNVVGSQETFGPSTKVEVTCALLDEETLQSASQNLVDQVMDVLLIDVSSDALLAISPLESMDELEGMFLFDPAEPTVVPVPDELVAKAKAWTSGVDVEPPERLQYYSAEDVPETPTSAQPKRSSRRRAPGAGTTGDRGVPSQKKRPTVAQLADAIQEISSTLPSLTSKLQELNDRTAAMEAQDGRPAERSSALRRPLSSAPLGVRPKHASAADLIKEMPLPAKASVATKGQHVTFSAMEAEEIASDLPPDSNTLVAAMMEQSKALTALVSQIASSAADPFAELGSATAGLSSKGSIGRAKLQAELAAHKGVFFQSVIQSMARRMHPAQSNEMDLVALRDRGVTPTQYLERFGGFGKTRDIGHIIWQLGLAMNFLQEDNVSAAKDAMALLFVCLEQTAMDAGNMQVGLLLSLTEDPPQALFTGRSLANSSVPKPFAPTASQRWVTVALQYLKEMDVIATRRSEVNTNKKGTPQGGGGGDLQSSAAPTQAPKKRPKGKAKGKGTQNDHQGEEDA